MEQSVFVIGNSAFITYKFLFERKVPKNVVYNHTSRNNKRPWYVRSHKENRRIKIIAYSSISIDFIRKYNLPSMQSLRAIAKVESEESSKEHKKNSSLHLTILYEYRYNRWNRIRSIYQNEFIDDTIIEEYCKTHMVFEAVLESIELGFKLEDVFHAYMQFTDLVFKTLNFDSFCRKVRQIKKSQSIESVLIHGLKNKISNHSFTTPETLLLIQKYYNLPQCLTARQITDKANKYLISKNLRPTTLDIVEKIIAKQEIKSRGMISREGLKKTREQMLPYVNFDEPQYEGEFWLMDGTRFQFYYLSESNKTKTLIYFVVLEAKTRKIIGYSYDTSENHVMAIAAFKQACKNSEYLPWEMLTDSSPAYRHKQFVNIRSTAESLAVNWRSTRGNPQDSAYIDRFFGVFQELICKKVKGYIGDGVTSKRKNGKPAPEEFKRNLSKDQLRKKNELILLIDNLIVEYNELRDNYPIKKRRKNPERRQIDRIEPISLNSISFSKLFSKERVKVFTNNMFIIEKDGFAYIYRNQDFEFMEKNHGKSFRVRFEEDSLEHLLVFDIKTDRYLCTLKRTKTVPKAFIERDQSDNKEFGIQSNQRKDFEKKLKEQVKQTNKDASELEETIPPEISQFALFSKKQREEGERELLENKAEKNAPPEKINKFTFKDEEESLEELMNNIYTTKGNLKQFKHGEN